MKNRYAAVITILAVGLSLTLFAADKQADRTTTEAATPRGSHARFKSEVIKVFAAKEGDALFRAYLVKWNGQEVIASDPLVSCDHRVGDSITVLAMDQPYPNGKPGPRLLHFQVVPDTAAAPPVRVLPKP